jgi:hypothetical protein
LARKFSSGGILLTGLGCSGLGSPTAGLALDKSYGNNICIATINSKSSTLIFQHFIKNFFMKIVIII